MVGRNEAPGVTTIHHTKAKARLLPHTTTLTVKAHLFTADNTARTTSKGSTTTRQCRHSYVFVLAKQHVDRTVHRVGSETARLHIGEGPADRGSIARCIVLGTALRRPISLFCNTPLHKLVLLRKGKALLLRDLPLRLTVDLVGDEDNDSVRALPPQIAQPRLRARIQSGRVRHIEYQERRSDALEASRVVRVSGSEKLARR